MKLLIDTREQLDYACFFEKLAKIHITKTLRIGDYSLEGYETKFSIERKTLNDFIGCTTSSRERFLRELERAKELDKAISSLSKNSKGKEVKNEKKR